MSLDMKEQRASCAPATNSRLPVALLAALAVEHLRAEADDVERKRRRLKLHEPYRTLLGHFRHEVGQYCWDRLIKDGDRFEDFRAVFGDEQVDYAEALNQHCAGPPAT